MTTQELKVIIKAVKKTTYKSVEYFEATKNEFEAKKEYLKTHTENELTEVAIGKSNNNPYFKLQNSKGNKYGNL